MDMAALFDPARIAVVDRPLTLRDEVLARAAELLAAGPADPGDRAFEPSDFREVLAARERVASTAVGSGVAFPHARVEGLVRARAAVLLLPPPGADLEAPDGLPVRCVVAVVVPPDSVGEHLKLIGGLARRLRRAPFLAELLAETDPARILRLLGTLDVSTP